MRPHTDTQTDTQRRQTYRHTDRHTATPTPHLRRNQRSVITAKLPTILLPPSRTLNCGLDDLLSVACQFEYIMYRKGWACQEGISGTCDALLDPNHRARSRILPAYVFNVAPSLECRSDRRPLVSHWAPAVGSLVWTISW
jgi:hypothetical protein